MAVAGPSGEEGRADPALRQNSVELEVGKLLMCPWAMFGCILKEAKEGLYFQIFIHLSHINPKGQFLGSVFCLSLNSQQTQQHITSQITVRFSRGCADGTGIFFDLKADDLRMGVLFPGGLVAEDCLF
jgi:hypothetical protein